MPDFNYFRHAIDDVLMSGVSSETKIENILDLFNLYQDDGIIIGWIESSVKLPPLNTYVNIRTKDGTKRYERLVTEEVQLLLRQQNWLWKPTFKDDSLDMLKSLVVVK